MDKNEFTFEQVPKKFVGTIKEVDGLFIASYQDKDYEMELLTTDRKEAKEFLYNGYQEIIGKDKFAGSLSEKI